MMDSQTDVDKVLLHLEAKEFTVEPSTLQSLQQLIQWVADLALNLLARLPEQRQPGKSSGVRHAFSLLIAWNVSRNVKLVCNFVALHRVDLCDCLDCPTIVTGAMQWGIWFRHCATSRNVMGLNPDGVIGIFHWHNTMVLGLTQALTEMSTRNISWG